MSPMKPKRPRRSAAADADAILAQIDLERRELARFGLAKPATASAPLVSVAATEQQTVADLIAELIVMGAEETVTLKSAHGTEFSVPLAAHLQHLDVHRLNTLVLTARGLVASLAYHGGFTNPQTVWDFLVDQRIKPPAEVIEPFGYGSAPQSVDISARRIDRILKDTPQGRLRHPTLQRLRGKALDEGGKPVKGAPQRGGKTPGSRRRPP